MLDPDALLPNADALLVALILAPSTFSRNKFFEMFQQEQHRMARRRAQLVRSVIKDLTEPWPHPGEIPGRPSAVVVEEVMHESSFTLTYVVEELGYRRSVMLTHLEAAALRYALERAGVGKASASEKALVDLNLAKLNELEPAPEGR